MGEGLKTVEEYRARAANLRTLATAYRAELRATMLEIAAHYEMLAESVVAIDRSNKKLNPPKRNSADALE